MDYEDKINEFEKVFNSYTIEDYYCDPRMKFLHPEFAKILEMSDLDFETFFKQELDYIISESNSTQEIYKDPKYQKLKVISHFFDINLGLLQQPVENNCSNIKGVIKLSNFNDLHNFNKKRITKSNYLQVPKNWKEVVSQFLESDLEKIGIYQYKQISYKDFFNITSNFEGEYFRFCNEEFNRFEMATIIAIKKALKSGSFFKNKNKILLDLRNGLSAEIQFKEKGIIISKNTEGKNAVISSEIVSLSDDNGRRVIGRLNKFYHFFSKDYLIKIEFVETGILR